jgi:hypothetical protein
MYAEPANGITVLIQKDNGVVIPAADQGPEFFHRRLP